MSNSFKKIVVFDIDGTLARTEHRLHHIQPKEGEKKNWGAFFREAEKDEPYEHIVNLSRLYHNAGYLVHLCTGRPANCRSDTIAWLNKVGVPYHELIMRLTTERGPDYVVKGATYLEFLEQNGFKLSQVEAVFEDRITVANMWRNMGLKVVLVGEEWVPKQQ